MKKEQNLPNKIIDSNNSSGKPIADNHNNLSMCYNHNRITESICYNL